MIQVLPVQARCQVLRLPMAFIFAPPYNRVAEENIKAKLPSWPARLVA